QAHGLTPPPCGCHEAPPSVAGRGYRETAMKFGRTASWERKASAAQNTTTVRRGFWPKLARFVARLPFAEDLLTAYYCAFDRHTPSQVRAILLGALAYFVLPIDA